MDVIIFLAIVIAVIFGVKFFKGYSRGKQMTEVVKEKALIDYKSMRAAIRKWFKERNERDLEEALECADELRKIERMATFSRAQDVKTSEQAMAFTYSKEIAKLLADEQKGFDLDFDFIEGKLELYSILMGQRTKEEALKGPPKS